MPRGKKKEIEEVPKEVAKTYSAQHGKAGRRNRRRGGAAPDSDIFTLGDAMKVGDMNLDDILGNLEKRSDVTIEKGKDGKTRVTQIEHLDKDGNKIQMIDIDGDGIPDIPDPTKKAVKQQKKVMTITDPNVLASLEKDKDKKKDDKPKEQLTMSDDDILAGLGKRAKYIAISMEDEDESDEDDVSADEDENLCMKCWTFCCRCKRCQTIEVPTILKSEPSDKEKQKEKEEEKESGAKGGMAASEVESPGDQQEMPAVRRMVSNYNRMLDENPSEFRDVLFRAIKLNGLDVVKLLCRLASRRNVSFGSTEMREPTSSATSLHVALLYNNEAIAEHLIRQGDRELLMATYTRKEYENQTALHLAVANGNIKLVEMLLNAVNQEDKRTLMNTVASGSFFREEHPEGQLCLSAAAWSNNSETLILLARHGASFATPNLKGNTLLHSIVISSAGSKDPSKYEKLIDRVFEAVGEWAKHCKYKTVSAAERSLEIKKRQIRTFHKLLALPNDNGATPLILAAQISSSMLIFLLNMEKIYKIPQSKFGSVAWVTYDVSDVTTFARDKYNKFSVFHVLAHNKGLGRSQEDEGESPLEVEPIRSLIRKKWSVYRWVYIGWCILHLIYMAMFTHFTLNVTKMYYHEQPTAGPNDEVIDYKARHDKHKKMAILFIFLPLVYIVLEFVDWIGSRPYGFQMMHNKTYIARFIKRSKTEWVITGNGPYRMVLVLFAYFAVIWNILFYKDQSRQVIPLSLTLLFGWVFVLFFTRGCRVTSRFSIMIQKMFFRDLLYFMAVFALIMVAFTFSVHAMYATDRENYIPLGEILYTMFNIVVEVDDKDDMPESHYGFVTKAIIIMYTIIGVVLLLNMLIAMMNTSYEVVRTTQNNIWKQQQLSIMLMLERRLFWLRKLCKYSEGNLWYKKWGKGKRAYIDVSTTHHKSEDGGDLDEQ